MDRYRKYGKIPYNIVVIHGGPGTPGEMAPVARELSGHGGVLEPFQTERSVSGQLTGLHTIIKQSGEIPVKLVGHSWGAWLAFMYAATYPSFVQKLVLVGSGPFEDRYSTNLIKKRLDRLSEKEKWEVMDLLGLMNNSGDEMTKESFKRFGEIMSKADSYDCLPGEKEMIDFQPDVFHSVWKEAEELRSSGELLRLGHHIECPVIAIHGDHDPHPVEGVKEPLSRILKDFNLIELNRCGHYPWKEKYAKDKFYDILTKEVVNY